jgi:nucleoside-diphosphate-sugar epimerase
MKVLVTGATGFIGNYVVFELLNKNLDVITTGIEPKNKIRKKWLEDVTYTQADLNESREDWFTFFGEPDMIIHLSWQGLPNYKELFHLEKNLPNNYYFIKNMVASGCKKVVVIGTCFEYGMQSGPLKEDLETKPDNPYALAKDTLRKYLEQLQTYVDFNLKWIRLFYMYGKGQNPNSILSQLEVALEKGEKVFDMSGGEQLRDYLPVEKVAENIVKISLQDKINGIINCCSGQPISIRNLVENYLKQNNKSIELNLGHYPYPDYEPMAFWGDAARLNLIWKPGSIDSSLKLSPEVI